MKKCSICKIEKEAEAFNKNNNRKDGLNTICRDCSKERSKQYYKDNKEYHKNVIMKRSREKRSILKSYILELLNTSECKDCGIKDSRVFEFDHLPEFTKSKDISLLINNGCSLDTLKSEIAKCDIVCANCHRIRTIERSPVNYRKTSL